MLRAGAKKNWVSAQLKDYFPNLGVAPPSHILGPGYTSLMKSFNPYAYYRLDEADAATTIVDSSGNGRNGTGTSYLGNADSPITEPPLRSGVFSTTPRFVDCGFKNSGPSRSTLTIIAWVFQTTRTNARIVGYNNGNTAQIGLSIGTQDASGTTYWEATINGTYRAYAGTTVISANAWHMLAATWDGDKIRWYIDGVLDATSASFGPSVTIFDGSAQAGNYAIGRARSDTNANNWVGRGAHVAFVSSTLTGTNISDLYAKRV